MAIAFDLLTESLTTGASTKTFSHTITGTNPILFVAVFVRHDISSTTAAVSSITYNGVALTKIAAQNDGATYDTGRLELWYLKAPATGANNVIVTLDASTNFDTDAFSYTGVDQTDPIGVQATPSSGNGGTNVTVTETETTGAANSWLLYCIEHYSGTLATPTGTQRQYRQNGLQEGIQDTPTTTTGSYSLSWNCVNAGGVQGWISFMVEIKAFVSVTTTSSSTTTTTTTTTTSSSTTTTTTSSSTTTTSSSTTTTSSSTTTTSSSTTSTTTTTTTTTSSSTTTTTSSSTTTTSSSTSSTTSTTLSTSSTITNISGMTFSKRQEKIITSKKY